MLYELSKRHDKFISMWIPAFACRYQNALIAARTDRKCRKRLEFFIRRAAVRCFGEDAETRIDDVFNQCTNLALNNARC